MQLRLFALLFLLGPAVYSQTLSSLVSDQALKHAGLSACVVDVASGKVVESHQPERSLPPASTQKLITTATALALLGPDYTYRTELQHDGRLGARGILMGNLYLTGYGDPTLGSDELEDTPALEQAIERFRLAVQQKGIRRVEGYVVGDATWWGTAAGGSSWQWNDLGNYYGAGAWALNLHENLYYLHYQQMGALGAVPEIAYIEPVVPELTFYNEVTSAGRNTGDNAYIYGAPYTYLRYIRGTIPVGSGQFTIKGSIPDPPLFAAQQLEAGLHSVGILASKGPASLRELLRQRFTGGERETLYTHVSPPLTTIVYRTNQKSVNLYAESLLRTLGREIKEEGSAEAGIEVIEDYWRERGLDLGGVYLADGSGLSPDNALPTRFLGRAARCGPRAAPSTGCGPSPVT